MTCIDKDEFIQTNTRIMIFTLILLIITTIIFGVIGFILLYYKIIQSPKTLLDTHAGISFFLLGVFTKALIDLMTYTKKQ